LSQCMNKSPQVERPCLGALATTPSSSCAAPCCLCLLCAGTPKICSGSSTLVSVVGEAYETPVG